MSNGVKMWIPSPDIQKRYQFAGSKVAQVPPIVIDSIPNGPNLEGPHN